MPKLSLTTQCDKARYHIESPKGNILSVVYLHSIGRYDKPIPQRVIAVLPDTDLAPDSEIAAFWYVRAVYENTKRPVWFWYDPTHTLIVFPAPGDDGSQMIVTFSEDEKPIKPVSPAPNNQ